MPEDSTVTETGVARVAGPELTAGMSESVAVGVMGGVAILERLAAGAARLEARLEAIDPEAEGAETSAGEIAALAHRGVKVAERARDRVLGPVRGIETRLRAAVDPVVRRLEAVKLNAKRKTEAALSAIALRRAEQQAEARRREQAAQEQERLEAARKLEAKTAEERVAAAAGERRAHLQAAAAHRETLAPPIPTGVKTDSGSVSSGMVWDFEIQQPDQVERRYCSPDPRLIRAAVESGTRELAGVRIFERPKSTVRGARRR